MSKNRDDWPREIGIFIRKARKFAGISQVGLAEASGISQATISQIETGTRKLTVRDLGSIAAALDIDLPDLFGRLQRGEYLAPKPPETVEIEGRTYRLVRGES